MSRSPDPLVHVGVLVDARYLEQRQPRALTRALVRRRVRVRTLVADRVSTALGSRRWLQDLDVVVARGRSDALLALLELARDHGVPVVDPPEAIRRVVDKAGTIGTLAGAGVPVPASWLGSPAALSRRDDLRFPLVLKPVTGDNASGTRVAGSVADLRASSQPAVPVLAQELHRAVDVDLKVYVAGEAVWAVERRSPIADDGSARGVLDAGTPVVPDAFLEAVVAQVRRSTGLRLLGVDCVRHRDSGRPLVVEVNDFPNYRGLPPAVDDSVADEVLRVAGRLRGSSSSPVAVTEVTP